MSDETERGQITWHCSEEDGGPDVGIGLGLGDGRMLWVGEITRSRHEEAGEDAAALGSDGGWWLILYGPDSSEVLAKMVNCEAANALMDTLTPVLRAAA